ncbi:hypothetical protein V8J88_02350 [Massilia sp. W12]|uniref:hypothetical protein n=1 Tax=Massilia sp. W12 TaxID=3126507 RepID=UPI0030D4375F
MMKYHLEKIDSILKSRILADASVLPELSASLRHENFLDSQGMNIALNADQTSYLISAPVLARPISGTFEYLFFENKKWYSLTLAGMFTQDISTRPLLDTEIENIIELQQSITAAFEVFGQFGNGPLDSNGIAVNAVLPNFVEVQ